MKQAADYLGYTEKGLRKIVARGDIKYFQIKPHASILFRQQWLDQFIDDNTHEPSDNQPGSPVKKPRKPKQQGGELASEWLKVQRKK